MRKLQQGTLSVSILLVERQIVSCNWTSILQDGLDTGRIRLADGTIDGLVKPAMEEIRAAAKAVGVDLPPDVCDFMINIDPLTMYLPPSMLGDIRKVRVFSNLR
jgi:ketopantoate reductase